MDVEQLIIEVSLTPAIWDSSHTKHSDRAYIAHQWRRIGDALGVSDEAAKKKFKNLRDQFRLELKKVPEGRAGDPTLPLEEYLSSWPWFRMMFFLKDKIYRRMASSSLAGVSIPRNGDELDCRQTDAFEEDNNASQDSKDVLHYDRLNSHLRDVSARTNSLKRTRECMLQSDYLAIEKQRLELLKRQSDEGNDSDRMFLLSLLPGMKTLELHRAHLFRLKVQQLLYDAQYSPNFGQ